jgi:hypothetical protein
VQLFAVKQLAAATETTPNDHYWAPLFWDKIIITVAFGHTV